MAYRVITKQFYDTHQKMITVKYINNMQQPFLYVNGNYEEYEEDFENIADFKNSYRDDISLNLIEAHIY